MNIFKIRKEYFIQKSELANEKIKNEKQEKKDNNFRRKVK